MIEADWLASKRPSVAIGARYRPSPTTPRRGDEAPRTGLLPPRPSKNWPKVVERCVLWIRPGAPSGNSALAFPSRPALHSSSPPDSGGRASGTPAHSSRSLFGMADATHERTSRFSHSISERAEA
jgi:hypothetical protein